MKKQLEKDLSSGSVVKQLIIFALPFIISNLLQSTYSVVDMLIVGNFAGTSSLSGVNIGSQYTLLITNFAMGLCVGATVLIGQYLGAKQRDNVKQTIGTLFTTLAILAVVLTILMIVFADGLLVLLQTPTDSFAEAKAYLIINCIGYVFIFGYNALSAIMRGMGDSKTPLYFVAIACVINIVLDYILVKYCSMGASGAAIATIVSQAVSMALCIIYLTKHDFIFDFKLSSFVPRGNSLSTLIRIGLPTTVQNVATSVSFLFLTAFSNSLGVEASAAVGVVSKVNTFAILPAAAMSASVSAMSAQNMGAGKVDRAKQTMYVGMLMAICMSYLIFGIVSIIPGEIIACFDTNPATIQSGIDYMMSFRFDYLLVPILFCLNGLFVGSGHTNVSLVNSCVSALFMRIPAAYILGITLNMGISGFGLGAPLATILALIMAIIEYVCGIWKKSTIIKHNDLI